VSSRTTILGIDAGGAAIAAIVAGAVYFGGILPARSAAEAAAREHEELSAKQEDLIRVESSLRTARRNLEKLTEEEPSTAPIARTPLDRIRRIGELAQASGVSLTEVSPGAEQPGRRFNRSPLMLRGAGRSPGFIGLLRDIHREFPDTQIVSMTISGSPHLRQADQSLEAELVWYTVARPGSAGSGPTAGSGPNAGAGGAPAGSPTIP
jgi:hypothetical protein